MENTGKNIGNVETGFYGKYSNGKLGAKGHLITGKSNVQRFLLKHIELISLNIFPYTRGYLYDVKSTRELAP